MKRCVIFYFMLHTLEQSRLFPYIAWTTVIALSCGTLWLVNTLQDDLTDLEAKRIYLETTLQAEL